MRACIAKNLSTLGAVGEEPKGDALYSIDERPFYGNLGGNAESSVPCRHGMGGFFII